MLLADKIIKLRKQFGWSQEDLAEKMNVSRQSVSKWESANSIPDLNKIIMLGEIFGVSTDYLLKDDVEESETITNDSEPGVNKIDLEEANNYVENKKKASKNIAEGVVICMLAIVPLLLLLSFAEGGLLPFTEEVAIALGMGILLVMVALGVGMFIKSSHNQPEIEKLEEEDFELDYGVKSIFKEKSKKHRVIYTKKLTLGVGLIIVGVIPLIASGAFDASDTIMILNVAVLIIIAAIGIYTLIPAVMEQSAYDCIVGEGDYSPSKKKSNKKAEKIAGVYWPLVTAIYLGWSFLTMNWHITWIIWPVAAVAFAAFTNIFDIVSKDDK